VLSTDFCVMNNYRRNFMEFEFDIKYFVHDSYK